MDVLQIFEQTAKSVRLVKRGVGAYLGEVRRVWVGALDDVAEQARQHLLAVEEAEEVLEPRNVDVHLTYMGCGLDMESYATGFNAGYDEAVSQQGEPGDAGFGPCECVCDLCAAGGHCDTASCATLPDDYPVPPSSPSGAPTAGDSSPAVSDVPPSPAGERPNPGEFAAVSVREVLAAHVPSADSSGVYCDGLDGLIHARFDDWFDWREHIGTEVSRRINAAAADRRVADRLDAAGFTKNTEIFEQHRNK